MTTEIISQCSIDGCERIARSRGWCHKHYCRWNRNGTMENQRPPLETRFWSFVQKTNSCWLWTGHLNDRQYGMLRIKGRYTRAHRVSIYIHTGQWPVLPVLHSCDIPRCVNPAHLREDTLQANVMDMVTRNRNAKGSRQGHAKLMEADIKRIRLLTDAKIPQKDIATMFGVSRDTVFRIQKGLAWRHVTL